MYNISVTKLETGGFKMKELKFKKISLEIDSELYYKYKYICEYYEHPMSIQLASTMNLYVHEFERVHGPIELNEEEQSD